MRRGTCQQGDSKNRNWESAGMAEGTSSFQPSISSDVLNRKRNNPRISQTSSVERSARCIQKTGKKQYKKVEQVLQDDKDTYVYEGQQKLVQHNNTRMSKTAEGMSVPESRSSPHHRTRNGYCPNGNVGNGVVVQMMETRYNDQTGRHGANRRNLTPPVRQCNFHRTTASCNPAENMSRNHMAPPMNGKSGHCAGPHNKRKVSEPKILNADNQTLKVSNLETLVIQSGSPTVIEVRSTPSQTQKFGNQSNAQAPSQAPAMTSSSSRSTPLHRHPSPVRQQHYAAPCGVESETTDDESSCDCATEGDPITNEDVPTNDYKTQSPMNDSEKPRHANNNNVDRDSCFCKPTGLQKQESPSRIPSTAANKRQHSEKCVSNNMLSNNTSQPVVEKASDQKSPGNGQQTKKSDRKPSVLNEIQTAGDTTKIVSLNSDSMNQTLKVSNLDTVVIQPGSPTLIQVRSVRNTKPSPPKEDVNQQDGSKVVSPQTKKNHEKLPSKEAEQSENKEIGNPQVNEPDVSEGIFAAPDDECCEWCEAESAATGDGQYASNSEKHQPAQKPHEYTPSSTITTPARMQDERKRICKEVNPRTSQFANTPKRSSKGGGTSNRYQQKGTMGYHHQSYQGHTHPKYVPVSEYPPRHQYSYPTAYHAPPARQYSPLPANYQMAGPPQADYSYLPVSRSSQNVQSANPASGKRYVDAYQPPPVHYHQQCPCAPQTPAPQYPTTQQWGQPQVGHQYQQDEPLYQTNDYGVGDGQRSNYGDPENEECPPEPDDLNDYYGREHYEYCDENVPYDDYQYAYNGEKLQNYGECNYVCH